ncbi:hypothetical protein JCM3765_001051 [Sporobolomyces pararoseus]
MHDQDSETEQQLERLKGNELYKVVLRLALRDVEKMKEGECNFSVFDGGNAAYRFPSIDSPSFAVWKEVERFNSAQQGIWILHEDILEYKALLKHKLTSLNRYWSEPVLERYESLREEVAKLADEFKKLRKIVESKINIWLISLLNRSAPPFGLTEAQCRDLSMAFEQTRTTVNTALRRMRTGYRKLNYGNSTFALALNQNSNRSRDATKSSTEGRSSAESDESSGTDSDSSDPGWHSCFSSFSSSSLSKSRQGNGISSEGNLRKRAIYFS